MLVSLPIALLLFWADTQPACRNIETEKVARLSPRLRPTRQNFEELEDLYEYSSSMEGEDDRMTFYYVSSCRLYQREELAESILEVS
jgi:hypothetical protein